MKSIKRQFKELKSSASPSREFKDALWSKLSDSYDESYSVAHVRSPFFRFAVVGVTAIILFVSTGAGVYAYESPEVVEGHPLHFVKNRIEQVEGRLAVTPEERVKYHIKMMGRRIEEAQRHEENVQTFRAIAPKIADELGLTRDELKQELIDPEERDALLLELSLQNDRYADILSRVVESEEELNSNNVVPLELPDRLREKLEEIRQELRDQNYTPQQKREFYRRRIAPYLNQWQEEQLNLIKPVSPQPSDQGTTIFHGTVLPQDQSDMY